MTLGEALQYVRKKNALYNTQEKLANITGIEKYFISMFERGEKYPTVKEWNIICDALSNNELRERGLCLIEYKRTHPDIKLCFSDQTICEKCGKKVCTVYGIHNGSPICPDDFNATMLKISREKGVVLESRKRKPTNYPCIENVCPHCGAIIGEYNLHDLWYGETETIQIEDFEGFVSEKSDE